MSDNFLKEALEDTLSGRSPSCCTCIYLCENNIEIVTRCPKSVVCKTNDDCEGVKCPEIYESPDRDQGTCRLRPGSNKCKCRRSKLCKKV